MPQAHTGLLESARPVAGADQYLLRVNDVSTQFANDVTGPHYAAKNVSFSVRPGETLGIVGESGSGKTVTMMSVLGLARHFGGHVTSGEAWFDGQDLLRLGTRDLRKIRGGRIGIVFQDPMTSLNPVMTIKRQLIEPLQEHMNMHGSTAARRALELLDMVRIADPKRCLDSYPHELSGGMRQRVMIAMALSCRPPLLIADEPTTALDVTIQAQILELIADFKRELKMAVVVISHDLGVVARLADRVAVMYGGSIVETCSVDDVLKASRHPYTLLLLRSALRVDAPAHSVAPPVFERFEGLPATGCKFRPRCDFAVEQCRHDVPELATPVTELHSDHQTACWEAGRLEPSRETRSTTSLGEETPDNVEQEDLLISVRNLRKAFPVARGFGWRKTGRVHAVSGVSFDVRRGETLGVVGESGCGKTTLGRLLLYLEKPSSGSVLFKGTDLSTLNQRQLRALRKNMQLVFQDPFASLDPRMTAASIIGEALRIHGIGDRATRERTVADLLERVGLGAAAGNCYPHQFSGGQRQRIGIARALALNPSFIVCDEAVSALDVSIQYQVLSLLARLARELKLTYLFISHNLAAVRFIADRILVMYLGKVIESAPTESLFRRPRHPYTQALLAAIPIPDPDVERNRPRVVLGGELASPLNPPPGCRFHTRCPHAQDICRRVEPAVDSVDADHAVACHLWKSINE